MNFKKLYNKINLFNPICCEFLKYPGEILKSGDMYAYILAQTFTRILFTLSESLCTKTVSHHTVHQLNIRTNVNVNLIVLLMVHFIDIKIHTHILLIPYSKIQN